MNKNTNYSGSRLFQVDVEASGKSPATGFMTEFGIVDEVTRQWFRGVFWDTVPNPDLPAQPLPTKENPHWTVGYSEFDLQNGFKRSGKEALDVFEAADAWLRGLAGTDRIVMFSDNPAYDYQWVNFGFDSVGRENPFGHSARRIGDYFAGLTQKWGNASRWKSARDVVHSHESHEDSQGNVGAFHLLRELEARLREEYPEYRNDADRIFRELKQIQKEKKS